ncbi:DNA-methyltransferase [Candidatus Venteria ishoeyi]|uniref:Methyltransferase n=1 Tax=Candidatus Venteria ishoeyi TaxID=1899563 RepID=A0A1H6FFG2_9GAMM|nr:DNA methyltransferase [Candidatus Venteria ishoeyi]MDM8547424.1 DNA methyltransferase [Candidatus Venteria ishoeyi]SEH08802.1 DNA adenine methyltransferase YhdJ [Candidatus Venteria ishoeyi]
MLSKTSTQRKKSATKKAPRNRTTVLTEADKKSFSRHLLSLSAKAEPEQVFGKVIHQDLHDALPLLPAHCVDLLIVDPPYNMNKAFNGRQFTKKNLDDYEIWLDSWIKALLPTLKKTASLYICGDWQSSSAIHRVAQQYFHIRNRITWEREKGRGAKTNWKNCAEDIWFCTVSNDYTFNVDAVKMRRKVIAPYTDKQGKPKDWQETDEGKFRITHPSNLWTDISIPFWSMPENTDHPTQKPEKLIAKLVLASSNPGDVVFDPFLGSGTSAVVAKKLKRQYFGIEIDQDYCCLTEKRLAMAEQVQSIQGYVDGCFWERNTQAAQIKSR